MTVRAGRKGAADAHLRQPTMALIIIKTDEKWQRNGTARRPPVSSAATTTLIYFNTFFSLRRGERIEEIHTHTSIPPDGACFFLFFFFPLSSAIFAPIIRDAPAGRIPNKSPHSSVFPEKKMRKRRFMGWRRHPSLKTISIKENERKIGADLESPFCVRDRLWLVACPRPANSPVPFTNI